jgi:hypothetical protein
METMRDESGNMQIGSRELPYANHVVTCNALRVHRIWISFSNIGCTIVRVKKLKKKQFKEQGKGRTREKEGETEKEQIE